MSVERGPKSLHEHNKSLLYSNRPKFKEDIRDNIYVDKIRNDGIGQDKIDENQLKKVIAEIRFNARKELLKQFKILTLSIFITILIMAFLKDYLDQRF
ncbi:hypothetical protein C8P64_2031 [Christiangramia gaetbulicola]|uniref:Uncharacterized protein n=1 Tax=Christiangramia gaetbulicola TaxID=703340 RepID=A0A2T6AI60_9FLAO|nr:hypothetical protein [Christiangramia gaetbulicola]PTX43503.1 hypothetical protein C8P64_2031 [Christiangramia gaetbulicola]